MLKQRIITALILAIVFIGTILLASHVWVIGLFSLVLAAASFELTALTIKPQAPIGLVVAIVAGVSFWLSSEVIGQQDTYYLALAGILVWLAIALSLFFYRHSGNWSLQIRLLQFFLGIILLWICSTGLVSIHRYIPEGGWLLLYLLTLVWVADIGAYFSGRRFGRHKLAPGISPGKTWEGVVGGLLANLAWMLVVFQLSNGWGLELWQFIFIGLSTSIISVVGDLYESILKREAAVKDSGKLLPGHGGVLDRIDSVIAATPVFVGGLYAVGML
jgi:phosphatidate cytidylyltransferase